MTDYRETVQMYRCQGCGKWSHAKRKPKKHLRTVWEGQPGFDPAKAEGQPWDYDGPDCHGIECGPFISYVAMPGRL